MPTTSVDADDVRLKPLEYKSPSAAPIDPTLHLLLWLGLAYGLLLASYGISHGREIIESGPTWLLSPESWSDWNRRLWFAGSPMAGILITLGSALWLGHKHAGRWFLLTGLAFVIGRWFSEHAEVAYEAWSSPLLGMSAWGIGLYQLQNFLSGHAALPVVLFVTIVAARPGADRDGEP